MFFAKISKDHPKNEHFLNIKRLAEASLFFAPLPEFLRFNSGGKPLYEVIFFVHDLPANSGAFRPRSVGVQICQITGRNQRAEKLGNVLARQDLWQQGFHRFKNVCSHCFLLLQYLIGRCARFTCRSGCPSLHRRDTGTITFWRG